MTNLIRMTTISKREKFLGDCMYSSHRKDGVVENGIMLTGRWFFYISDIYVYKLWDVIKDKVIGIGSKTFRSNDNKLLFKVIIYTRDYRDIDNVRSVGKELLDILSEFGINKIFHVTCYDKTGKYNPCSVPRFDTEAHTMIKINDEYIFNSDRFKPKDKREIYSTMKR